jgi:succinate dehydrogenase / fumarate reductase cytochrome b subunit
MVRNQIQTGRSISTRPRPLSPHLTIYKSQYSSRLSISHRVSGCALAFVLLLRCTVLNRVTLSTSFLGGIVDRSWFRGLVGILPSLRNGVRLCRILSLVYHRVNGCRHLVWDSGKLLDKATRDRSSLTVRAISVGLSLVIFFGWVA